VIQQLLSLARSEPSHVMANERVDLSETARAATFELATQALDKSIDLGFDDGGAVPVEGQPLLLRELVSNLVDNAIRYTPEGGRIAVRVVHDAEGAPSLQVEDSGPGIPAEERARVFDRFVRLQGSRADGCGLGLPIVKQIAERHGASIQLADAHGGHGLSVTVRFPRTTHTTAPTPSDA
jgi:two-component system sensor histidine kinase TctE